MEQNKKVKRYLPEKPMLSEERTMGAVREFALEYDAPVREVPFGQDVVAVATIWDEPWIRVADVVRLLGYKMSRPELVAGCDPEGVAKVDAGRRLESFISRPNLHRLVAHSEMPAAEAEALRRWVDGLEPA
jgi:prophage antirepressor-like protein